MLGLSGKMKVVIVGSGPVGFNVANNLLDREDVDITVFEKTGYGGYVTCAMPYVLEGKIKSAEDIWLFKPEFYKQHDVNLRLNTTVTKLNLDDNTVNVGGEVVPYDRLVLAVGRTPVKPPISGIDLKGVYTLSWFNDMMQIQDAMKTAKNAVVIGAGLIGLETAVAFNERGIKTTVVELLPSILPQMLDPDMAHVVQSRLEEVGIKILTSTSVTSIEGREKAELVKAGGWEIPAELVLNSVGMQPNVELAREAGIEIGAAGGIVTDASLHVKKGASYLPNVYAGGDCVEAVNGVTSRPTLSMLASAAIPQALIIAKNILGGNHVFEPTTNPAISVISGLHVGAVGLTTHAAKMAGIKLTSATHEGLTHVGFFAGAEKMYFKFLAHGRRLLGAQIISRGDVKERINLMVMAIKQRIAIDELVNLERCFTPPLCTPIDPMITALNKLNQK